MKETQEICVIKEYVKRLFCSYVKEEEMPDYIDFYEYKKYMLKKMYYDLLRNMESRIDSDDINTIKYDCKSVILKNMPQFFQECITCALDKGNLDKGNSLFCSWIPPCIIEAFEIARKDIDIRFEERDNVSKRDALLNAYK